MKKSIHGRDINPSTEEVCNLYFFLRLIFFAMTNTRRGMRSTAVLAAALMVFCLLPMEHPPPPPLLPLPPGVGVGVGVGAGVVTVASAPSEFAGIVLNAVTL